MQGKRMQHMRLCHLQVYCRNHEPRSQVTWTVTVVMTGRVQLQLNCHRCLKDFETRILPHLGPKIVCRTQMHVYLAEIDQVAVAADSRRLKVHAARFHVAVQVAHFFKNQGHSTLTVQSLYMKYLSEIVPVQVEQI